MRADKCQGATRAREVSGQLTIVGYSGYSVCLCLSVHGSNVVKLKFCLSTPDAYVQEVPAGCGTDSAVLVAVVQAPETVGSRKRKGGDCILSSSAPPVCSFPLDCLVLRVYSLLSVSAPSKQREYRFQSARADRVSFETPGVRLLSVTVAGGVSQPPRNLASRPGSLAPR